MGSGVILFLALVLCYVEQSNCRIWEIPIPESLKDCYKRANSAKVDRYVGSVYSWLCEHSLTNSSYVTEQIPKELVEYVNQLEDIALDNTTERKPCVRKEYRMLTFEERRRYHDAVNALKRDTSISPNKYDALASIDAGVANLIAHGGPGFLGWHRVYLLIFETALRQVDPRVCLPYWDSTLDSKLQDPFTSSIWTHEYLGTPRGKVVDGPFANWVLPNGGELIRNVGIDGDVLTTDIVNDILSRTSYDEIISSYTMDPQYQLELHHGSVLMFVGGAMARIETAASDPVFFMHHAFIDHIWERFRSKLRSINVDPTIYPSTLNAWHLANASMGIFRLTQADGYSENIANRVTYEPVLTCNPDFPFCGERYVTQIQGITLESTSGAATNRSKRQVEKRCVRKEYRMLTPEERIRYHNAVKALKKDTSIKPNKYDNLAMMHSGSLKPKAYGGPGFLGWNRMYILTYENALRQVDPRVCLPYWDSTLDSKLEDPLMSSIWSPEFLGTPRGKVVEGPFANWALANGGSLIRNVGVDARPLTTENVDDILSRDSYDEIFFSENTDFRYLIELQSGSVHGYVGGTMGSLQSATYDPIFFMHRAFIDFIFERFRAKLRSIRVNPEIYPLTENPNHQGNVSTGLLNKTHADGYSENIAKLVTYEPVPTCSLTKPTCGTRSSLVCDKVLGLCIPTTRTIPKPRTKRQAITHDTCKKPTTYALPNQNDFCVGLSCDADQWVMIPVKIVSVRPPKFGKYNSYPVKNGRIDDSRDIYAPNVNEDINKHIYSRQGNLKTYKRCEDDSSVGQIFLYSHGINYSGYYKESTIVDQKLTVSVSLGFVGVKKPSEVEGGVSKALLRAHDSCGRVCQVTCRDADSKSSKLCSGAVAVDDKMPRMFGQTLDEAVMSIGSMDYEVPKFDVDNLYITFYCDYRGDAPFAVRND